MKYKSKGMILVPGCTPSPSTALDNRSCRERTGCTREECIPKKLKCDWCGTMESRLSVLEEIETEKENYVCSNCRNAVIEDIDYSFGNISKPPKIDVGNRFA